MPSCVFTRAQVLNSLPDEVARREAEAIPEFIYLFLRDVFLAVDEDGDGYVTGEAVSRLFPAFTPVGTTKDAASCPAASGFMAPTVRPTWWSPTSYIAPTRCAATAQQRPLDFCSFMQTYWPMVSDKMAHLVCNTWSQQRSDSLSDAVDNSCEQCASTSRRPICSPSPFRDVSAPPVRGQPTSPLAAVVTGSYLASSPARGAGTLSERESVAPEQHRLYCEAIQCMWTSGYPLSPHAFTPSPELSVSSPIPPPCPQRLLTENDMEELLVAFSYLDRHRSGYVGVADVADALQSLLRTAACPGQGFVSPNPSEVSDEVRQLAHAMLRVALSSTATPLGAAVAQGMPNPSASFSEAPPALPSPSSSGPCMSWTVFARSFQCDTGAFPAELIAWCAGCARTSREPSPRALATAPQWMSPVECAYVQQLLVSYVDVLCAEKGRVPPGPSLTATEKADPAPVSALSQRFSVNTRSTRKSSQRCQSTGTCDDHRHSQYVCHTHATTVALQQWCRHTDAQAQQSAASGMTTLPLALLEAGLRQDLRAFLFPETFKSSAAAGAALEEVVEHHVRAVCALARRTALLPAHCHSPNARMEGKVSPLRGCGGHLGESVSVDVNTLVDVITADPRCLQLEVLVPLESRLSAVVDAAQHHPRRLVEEAVRLLSLFVHSARRNEGVLELAGVLELRCALFEVSPSLARLITGSTCLREGRLCLEECMVMLSTHVLSVPPPLPVSFFPFFEETVFANSPLTTPGGLVTALCDHPGYAMLQDARLLKASHGWLRYACRRLSPLEQRTIIEALQLSCGSSSRGGSLFKAAARDFGAILDAEHNNREQQHSLSAYDMYSAMLPQVRASCWVCRVDPVVAAHVTLVLVAASASADTTALTEESVWWANVSTLLGQWVSAHHRHSCLLGSADAWAMNAIICTAAELGLSCCRAVSKVLSHLHITSPIMSRVMVVEEEELTQSLTRVVGSLSVWAPSPSANAELKLSSAAACARLVDTLVGACPRHETTLVDVSSLLRRWLEAYPLPLPVTHLSLCCAVQEVGSAYYTLKRLAASEEDQRRRSKTPAGRAATPPCAVSRGLVTTTAASRGASPAPVVTGISPVCLSALLENEDLLLAIYAVSPPEAVGVWGGALCHLGALLRPLLLSSTGIRVSLDKLSARPLRCGGAAATASPSSADLPPLAMDASHRSGGQNALEDAIRSMAVPASVQHAVAQLFACVDAEGTGAVTEDQLRSHRSQVPATARYGWHRFVTALCSSYAMTSSLSSSSATAPRALIAGGLSAGVLQSHRWQRRHRAAASSLCCAGKAQSQAKKVSCSSVTTQHTDDDAAATYSLEDVLIRMAELRVCVQVQLLEESSARAEAKVSIVVARKAGFAPARATTDADSPLSKAAGQNTTVPSPPTAGTAQWWATYLEKLCQSYSPLAL